MRSKVNWGNFGTFIKICSAFQMLFNNFITMITFINLMLTFNCTWLKKDTQKNTEVTWPLIGKRRCLVTVFSAFVSKQFRFSPAAAFKTLYQLKAHTCCCYVLTRDVWSAIGIKSLHLSENIFPDNKDCLIQTNLDTVAIPNLSGHNPLTDLEMCADFESLT